MHFLCVCHPDRNSLSKAPDLVVSHTPGAIARQEIGEDLHLQLGGRSHPMTVFVSDGVTHGKLHRS